MSTRRDMWGKVERRHFGLDVWGGEEEDRPGTQVWRFSQDGCVIARAHLTPTWRETAMGNRRKWYAVRLELRVAGHGRDWAQVEGLTERMRRDDLLRQLARQLRDGAWWREAELRLYDQATPRGLTYKDYSRATCTMQPVEAIRWLQDWLREHPTPAPEAAGRADVGPDATDGASGPTPAPEANAGHPDPAGCAVGQCTTCQAEAQADPVGHLQAMTPADASALAWFDRGEPMTGPLPEGQVQRLQSAGWLTFAPDSHRLVITLGGIEALAAYEARGDARACSQRQCWYHDAHERTGARPAGCCPWCGCSHETR